jgi:hypothetical protein
LDAALFAFGDAVRTAENLSDGHQFPFPDDGSLFFSGDFQFFVKGNDRSHGLSTLSTPLNNNCDQPPARGYRLWSVWSATPTQTMENLPV